MKKAIIISLIFATIMLLGCSSMQHITVSLDMQPSVPLKSKGIERIVVMPFEGSEGKFVSRRLSEILSENEYFKIKDNTNKKAIDEEFKLLLDLESGTQNNDIIQDKINSLGADALLSGNVNEVEHDQYLRSTLWKQLVPVYNDKGTQVSLKTVWHKTWTRTGWCKINFDYKITSIKSQTIIYQDHIKKEKTFVREKTDEKPFEFTKSELCDPTWEPAFEEFRKAMIPHSEFVQLSFFKVSVEANKMGIQYASIKKWDNAINEFQEALKTTNSDIKKCDLGKILYNIALIYDIKNRPKKEEKALNNAFQLCPEEDKIKQALSNFN